jgi:hypothetical protein
MAGFDVRVDGDEPLRRKLAFIRLQLDDLRGFWPLLVPVVHGWMSDQFASEGGWGGAPWAPLSPAYAAEKARRFPGRSILIREGTLRRAASEMRREVSPRTLTMWVDDPVAGYHQDGTTNMPARPLIPLRLPESAVVDVDLAAEEYVSTLVRRVF